MQMGTGTQMACRGCPTVWYPVERTAGNSRSITSVEQEFVLAEQTPTLPGEFSGTVLVRATARLSATVILPFFRKKWQILILNIAVNVLVAANNKRDKNRAKAKRVYEFTKSAPVKLAAGKWTHFAVTWSKSGAAVFVDGKKVLSDPVTVRPADTVFKNQGRLAKNNIAEYTCIGADGHRYFDIYNGTINNNYFKGAADELRVSKVVRYKDNFTPAKEFAVDKDTCALFSYEKNFDGASAVGSRYISGSIF